MSNVNATLRRAREAITALGLTLDDVATNKHIKLYVSGPAGRRVWVISGSASDVRHWKNSLCDLRKIARECGCSGAALRFVMPLFGTDFVTQQHNNVALEPRDEFDFPVFA